MSAAPPRRKGRSALVVMARWPAPGRCKRRLAAGSGPRRAAAVQSRLSEHTLATAREALVRAALDGTAPELVLAVSGLGPRAARRWGRRLGADRVQLQGPGGLGLRMTRQLVRARRRGATAVVLIGSDLPTLEPADLLEAFERLASDPLVLGPARDGGYWLIGLARQALGEARPAGRWRRRGEACGLFSGRSGAIGWGGAQVLEGTLEAARAAGLDARLLAERGDLDRPADLRLWR